MCVGGMRMSTIATSGSCWRTLQEQLVGVARLADDLEARILEQAGDALAEQHRVVGDHDPQARAEADLGAASARSGREARPSPSW